MQSSVGEIRSRLLLLLVRAFVFVLVLSLVLFLAVVSYFLASPSSPIPIPFSGALQGYYLGHGNWEGVEVVFESNDELRPLNAILLDEEQHVILDRRQTAVLAPGSTYEIQPNDVVMSLTAQDKKVGKLIINASPWTERLGFAPAIILPVGIISFILVLFLVVVSVLLVRRFVKPLADVIYAARAVAGGDLSTRIPSEGPQDLRSLSESFNEMASALERNDHERRDMLADIAHELRTPLSVIRGRLEGIVDGVYPANKEQVSLALEQTYLVERLLDDLRLLTLAETRELAVEKTIVHLDKLLQHTLELFSAEAGEKKVALSLEATGGDFQVEIDPQRTEQVIGNLISNSLRYAPVGSRVRITLEESRDDIELRINDDGPGVAEEDLPHLFERFWRKEKSRSRASGGTGLGLAIARQLVEAQGGQIFARNLPTGGLQIGVTLRHSVA